MGEALAGLDGSGVCRGFTRSLFHAIVLGGPGGDRLSRVLRHSTMGAEAFDGRVRDGIGSLAPR